MDALEQQKLDALAEFAAGAGHELNNPLAVINGHVQLLLQEITNPEHRRKLGIIAAQVQRAYEMIADVRFFARPPQPEYETVDLVQDLRKLVAEQTPLMNKYRITLHLETDTEKLEVRTDPVQLHCVLIFLCNNAREAIQRKSSEGNVRLVLTTRDSIVQISVEDDGDGIEENIRSRIFDPYFSGRQAGRGLGFGLPKSWRIMQQLGGSIDIEQPALGKGTRFVVRLSI